MKRSDILINIAYTMRAYPLTLRDIAFRNFAYAGNVIGNCFRTSIGIKGEYNHESK